MNNVFFQNIQRFLKTDSYKGPALTHVEGNSTTRSDNNSVEAQDYVQLYNEHDTDTDSSQSPLACDESKVSASSNKNSATLQPLSDSHGVKVTHCSPASYFDKKPYCFFCDSQQTQIQRHWLAKHRNEREVIELSSLVDKSDRIKCITKLRNLGNHLHNSKVLQEGQGDFLVTYRPKAGVAAEDYRPCESCWCYLLKGELFRHRCKFPKSKPKGRVAANAYLLLPTPSGTSAKVHQLLSGMNDGNVKLIAKTDSLIVDYAAKFICRKGMTKKGYIRNKVRELARFLIEIRKQRGMNNTTLNECISPEHFKQCVLAINSLAGFDEETSAFKIPSLALKIGQALIKVTKIVKRNAIEMKDGDRIKDADYFSELCSSEWSETIARQALGTLQSKKRNKVNLLPLSSDVKKLNSYLNNTSDDCLKKLSDTSHPCIVEEVWRRLAEVTLANIITFNRRRQGEVSKMTVEDYSKKTTVSLTSDSIAALSPMEQSLCKLFARIEIPGKRDRTVPILMHPRVQKAVDVLIQYRVSAGIRPTNNYLFAYSNSDHHLRGSDILRNASVQCRASNPAALRSTNFRKHVATLCQVLNMKNNELDMLANYMGHDIRTHRQFYRLPDDVLQTSKLAKIFLLMDSGTIAEQKGKSLDEIMMNIPEDYGEMGKYKLR